MPTTNKPIQLGLCCLNITLRNETGATPSRKKMLKTVLREGVEPLKELILKNLEDVKELIRWNESNGIRVYRLSSTMFPHITNPQVESFGYDFALKHLEEIGELARSYCHRLTFHPGQYNVLATPSKKALENTMRDLEYHAKVFDYIGCDKNSVMVIHGGGLYNNKEKTKQRWCEVYQNLPYLIKRRLVLENCEHSFNIQDCLDISKITGIPIVFDTHHFDCYNKLHPDEPCDNIEIYIPQILETWSKRGIKPKFHVSEQGCGKTGHHSEYIESIPQYLLEIPEKYGIEIDIMIEAKMKELAIKRLYEKYPFTDCNSNITFIDNKLME